MGQKLVKPDQPSSVIQREVEALPTLPRAEAQRIRRATRSYVDLVLPQIIREVVSDALSAENPKVRQAAQFKLIEMAMQGKSNEELDPHETEVDGEVVGRDPVDALEEATLVVGDGKGT